MSFIKKIFKNEWFFVFIASTILIVLAFIPYIHQTRETPKDNVFLGTHNNSLDYPMFISEILQSKKGRWTFLATFTSEKQTGTLVHPIYIFFGKLGIIFNLSPVFLYHLARIIFGYTLAFSTYYFLKYLFLSISISKGQYSISILKTKIAFFLSLFSAGFAVINWKNYFPEIIDTYLSWWTGGDVLKRALFQPHAMLKNTLLLLILTWMGRFLSGDKKRYFYYSLPAALFLGLLDPINTMSILILLMIYGVYKSIKILLILKRHAELDSASQSTVKDIDSGLRQNDNNGNSNSNLFHQLFTFSLPLLNYAFFALISLIYMNWVFGNTPWKAVRDWEAKQFYTVPFWEYANHIGITFYLGIIGLLLMLARKKKSIFVFFTETLCFSAMFLIITGVTQKFGLSTLRFFQTPVYIFLAAGTSELIITLINLIKSKTLKHLTLNFALLTIIIISLPAYISSYKNQWNEFEPWYWNVYPDKKNIEAMTWLKNYSNIEEPVLSNSLVGGILPAVSGNAVYVGHIVSTINYEEKDKQANLFVQGKMDNAQAETLIKNGRIKYIYLTWGEQDRIDAKNYQ